jgi:hypothetical protein
MRNNGNYGMKSPKEIPFLLLFTAGSAFFFGCVAFLAVRHTDARWGLIISGLLGGFASGVYSLRSRGLRYSATIREFHTAAMRGQAGDRPQPAFAEFNHANARLLRASLLLYLAVVVLVWAAASYFVASPTMAFLVTIAAFIAVHVIRIAQLEKLPDISLGLVIYAGTAFGSLVAVGVGGGAFWYTLTKAGFSWQAFWLVGFCLVLISCLLVHADFTIAGLLRRSTHN